MKGISQLSDGITVDIDVSPGSNMFEITGYNQWRERFEVRIQSIPHKGKANKDIIKSFSNLTKRPVEIVSGHKTKLKTIKIFNITKKQFLDIIKQTC
ncbi:MAG: DUF167 family protein [Methanomicrobiales archaeon]